MENDTESELSNKEPSRCETLTPNHYWDCGWNHEAAEHNERQVVPEINYNY